MKQLFCMYDKKANARLDPFASLNSATAMREIQIKLGQDETLRQFADDFVLLRICDWDPEGGLVPESVEETVIEVAALITKEQDAADAGPGS